MIFNNNSTSLGTVNIPMAEGYDCAYGTALALVESARNDLSMFNALLGVEAREIQINNESAGYVNEAEIVSLQEATVSGIFAKIKELFSKLVAKIKAIAITFMSKLNSLFMNDKQMVKKYQKEILRKTNLGNMEVKWSTVKNDPASYSLASADSVKVLANFTAADHEYKEDSQDRIDYFCGKIDAKPEWDSFAEDMHEYFFEDEETDQLKNFTTIREVLTYLDGSSKTIKDVEREVKKLTGALEKLVSEADKAARDLAKKKIDADETPEQAQAATDAITNANHVYEMAVSYQTVALKENQAKLDAVKFEYKQYKAAFMKAIAANDKKLEESALYLDAVAEAAEEEVESVIAKEIDSEELSDLNNASKSVLDADVCDDPEKLTGGVPSSYTDSPVAKTAGTIDPDVNSREEAAYFGGLFY